MPFRMMSRVGRGMGVLDTGRDRRRKGAVLGVNLGHPTQPFYGSLDFVTAYR